MSEKTKEVKSKKKKKGLKIALIIILVIVLVVLAPLLFLGGPLLFDMIANRPGKPQEKHGEFPFELVYEYDGEEFTVNETIVCDFERIEFSIDGGNKRKWNCYIEGNEDYGRYYLDHEKNLYIQIPLEADYYMGDASFDSELAKPYIFFIDESTGTTYYEQDLMEVAGAKIISWTTSEPLTGNIK